MIGLLKSLAITTFLSLMLVMPAHANNTKIASGASVKVDQHGACRIVKNNGGAPLMVPHAHANEWVAGANSFLSNLSGMNGVSVSTCAPPVPVLISSCSANGSGFSPCYGQGIAAVGSVPPENREIRTDTIPPDANFTPEYVCANKGPGTYVNFYFAPSIMVTFYVKFQCV